jgi:uncharacterized protein (DUF1778 family)
MQTVIPAPTSQVKKVHTPAIADCGAFAPETRANTGFAGGPPSISAVHKQATQRIPAAPRPSARSKFIKVRVSPDEYSMIARQADIASQPMSEYVREQVLAVHETLDLKAELATLRGLLGAPVQSTGNMLALEAVLLLRELAAARDAQILSRVRAQLAQRNGGKA